MQPPEKAFESFLSGTADGGHTAYKL